MPIELISFKNNIKKERLKTKKSTLRCGFFVFVVEKMGLAKRWTQHSRTTANTKIPCLTAYPFFIFCKGGSKLPLFENKKSIRFRKWIFGACGGEDGTRTHDLLTASQAL